MGGEDHTLVVTEGAGVMGGDMREHGQTSRVQLTLEIEVTVVKVTSTHTGG